MTKYVVNGKVWTAGSLQEKQIQIDESGKVSGLFDRGDVLPQDGSELIDAGGKLVLPGGLDMHAHTQDGAERFYPATCAAAVGGITTVVDMPPFHTCTTLAGCRERMRTAEHNCVIDFGLGGGIVVSHDDLNDLQAVAEFGAPYFKVFMPAEPPVDTALLWASVQVAARTGLRLALHAEENACLDPNVDWDNPRGFAQARPVVAETSATAQVLEMALAAGAPVHICHVSAGRTADLIDTYRGWGAKVTAETTPHFLIFEESDFERLGSLLKTTPPLRQAVDRDLLWQALRDGVLGAVVSDHYLGDLPVPGKVVKGIREREAGIAGLEVSLPLLYDAAVGQGRLSLRRFVEVTSQGPARFSGFDFCKGSIAAGMDADLVIFDPQADWTPAVVPFSRLSETPYEDRKMHGRVEYTIVRGTTVWDGKEICAARGTGKYIGTKRRPNPLH